MKKLIGVLAALFVLCAVVVSATDTELTPDMVEMEPQDEVSVNFCINQSGYPLDVKVVVHPICRDVNGLLGCQSGDIFNPAGFNVLPTEYKTGSDGCTELEVITSLSPDTEGTFYYTVNGKIKGAKIGSETGRVDVHPIPEFTTVGAGLVLVGAGAYLNRRRQKK